MLTQEEKDMETLLSTFAENIGSQQDQHFLQDDNVLQKKKKRGKDYSNTKVKTRNLLTSVSYRRFKQLDLKKKVLLLIFYRFWCKILIR